MPRKKLNLDRLEEKINRARDAVGVKTNYKWVVWKGNTQINSGPISKNTQGEIAGFPGGNGNQSVAEFDDMDYGHRGARRNAIAAAALWNAGPELIRRARLLDKIVEAMGPRAEELAERLVARGAKAEHVSASETHEIRDVIMAVRRMLKEAGDDT